MLGSAIRVLCSAPKSRANDHFQCVHGYRELLEGRTVELPDYAFDQHTTEGRRMGRGLDYFRNESTKLVVVKGISMLPALNTMGWSASASTASRDSPCSPSMASATRPCSFA